MGCCGRSDRLTIAVVAEKYGNKIWRPPHVEPIAGADGVPEDQQILSDHHCGPADKEKVNDIGHRRWAILSRDIPNHVVLHQIRR